MYRGPLDLLHNRMSVRAEYLLWFSSVGSVPSLITTSTAGTAADVSGVLGESATSVLLRGGGFGSDAHSGVRVALDYWLDPSRLNGVEATYLGTGRDASHFQASSAERPILARPYFDVTNGAQAAMLVAHPDFLTGSITATSSTELESVEILFRRALMRRSAYELAFLVGWRFARLDESLRVAQSAEWTAAQGQIVVGTTKDVFDLFEAKNDFHGAELGLLFKEYYGPWSLDLLMKLGLGSTRSEVVIDGQTLTTVPTAGSATFTGGLLAQETNIGRYSQDALAVIPELGITLGYSVTRALRLTFGYTFIYWSTTARPGNQIDLDVSQLPPEDPGGAGRPRFTLETSDYWAQGLNFGLDYRF